MSNEESLQQEFLRHLHQLAFLALGGPRLTEEVFRNLRSSAELVSTLRKAEIADLFLDILSGEHPSRSLSAMNRTGLLRLLFPALADCVGCGQNPKYHSYPVFEHLITAADAACSLTDRLDVRFAALCHDLGKAPTREVRPGGGPDDVSFHNHEIVSTRLTYEWMTQWEMPHDLTQSVVRLVRYHQYKYDRTWTDKAVRRFIRDAEIVPEDLRDLDLHPQFLLRQADRMGNALKASVPITDKQRDFQERIRRVLQEQIESEGKRLAVTGAEIREKFNLPAAPIISQVMKHLHTEVEKNPELNEPDKLFATAKDFLGQLEVK